MEFVDPWDTQSRARVVHSGAHSTPSPSSTTAGAPPSLPLAASCAAAAGGGSFEQFLRKRKPLDPRAEAADASDNAGGGESADAAWSAGDDRALLNALKEFPKDTAMRWEKVAAAVPGKTKAACMKRITELKRDFRSTKAASQDNALA